jgi:hypothetical protein
MRTQWKPPTAIESIFVQIQHGIAFAAKGNDETNKPTILRWAYDIVKKTGRYDLVCREWRQFGANKTTKEWVKFKAHFKAADRYMQIQATTGTTGYHGDHAVTTDSHAVNATLLVTTKADLTARDIALAQAMPQASLSSSRASIHTVASTTSLSTLTTPDTCPPAY